jgi:hypothetical protein
MPELIRLARRPTGLAWRDYFLTMMAYGLNLVHGRLRTTERERWSVSQSPAPKGRVQRCAIIGELPDADQALPVTAPHSA